MVVIFPVTFCHHHENANFDFRLPKLYYFVINISKDSPVFFTIETNIVHLLKYYIVHIKENNLYNNLKPQLSKNNLHYIS